MMRRRRNAAWIGLLGVLSLGACADQQDSTAVSARPRTAPTLDDAIANAQLPGRGGVGYVAIGTSVSMGVGSDGVVASSQAAAWPAQFAALIGRQFRIPSIDPPGCGAPLVGPLVSGIRLSGEPAGRPDDATAICAPNSAGVTLPTNNVAIEGARASDALFSTSATYPGTLLAGEYSRVLPPGYTQVTAMLVQRPRLVTVELGANELLGVRFGVYSPAVVTPLPQFELFYSLLLGTVAVSARQVVLVGLIHDASELPAFRTGQELWDARATFLPFNVMVGEDCGTTDATNVLFVPVRVPLAVATGSAQAQAGAGPYTLSCANVPSSTAVQDYVITADEMAKVNAQGTAMNAFIKNQARIHGWAYFELDALFGRPDLKPPFNAIALMTDPVTPYGPYITLDGIHPNAAGHQILAEAAAAAFNAQYGTVP